MKKGQGLSLNTVVIAAIVLIVLVVLVAIFTGRLNVFHRELVQCENKGGSCSQGQTWDGKGCTEGYYKVPSTKCSDDVTACCAPISNVE